MELFSDEASASAPLDIRTKPEDSLNHFTINKEFAERYLHNKQRAELHQLEAKYGKDGDVDSAGSDSDSESDVTEDEDGDQVTANVDAAIFRTLQRIRNKDAALYDHKTDVFAQEAEAAERAARESGSTAAGAAGAAGDKKKSTTKKEKKVTLQDYQRQRVQELIETSENPAEALADATTSDRVKGIFHDDDDDAGMPFAQEQEELRKEVSQAFHAGVGDEDDLFVKRSEASSSTGATYRDAVIASLGPDASEDTIREAIRRNRQAAPAPVLAEVDEEKKNEDFLMNYILNRGWIDKSAEDRPSKPKLSKSLLKSTNKATSADSPDGDGEPVGDDGAATNGQAYGRDWEAEAADLESEASFDSMADAFETAYNFRFEQGPESLTIPTYSRTPKDSARREDTTRKRKREERAARKEEEKKLKMQEMARLKNLKRQEIVEKLKKLREVTGAKDVDGLGEELDLEGDFDPDAHDKAMQKAFGDEYYGEHDEGMEKPQWDDDIDIDDIINEHEAANAGPSSKKQKKNKKSNTNEDDDRIEMDADFLEGEAGDEEDGGLANAGGSKEAALRAKLADKKLSKKERKKLKKKLKAALSKSPSSGHTVALSDDEDADGDGDGVDEDAMNADVDAAPSSSSTAVDKKSLVDSYYNLDYEDMIGDLPTRFKYTQVAKADYGMSAVDILLADDEQLNSVVGLKNLQPYRRGKNRPIDLGKKLGQFRRDVYGNTSRTRDGEEKVQKKRLGKKERLKLKAAEADGSAAKNTDDK